jgi:hypothetical protein
MMRWRTFWKDFSTRWSWATIDESPREAES